VQIDREVLNYSGKEPLANEAVPTTGSADQPGRLLNITRMGNGIPHQAGTPVVLVARACTGDCERSDSVTVTQLITMVNVALGNGVVANCPPGDANGDGAITIDEIIQAVSNALTGCGR
jgi:hypothetical protein